MNDDSTQKCLSTHVFSTVILYLFFDTLKIEVIPLNRVTNKFPLCIEVEFKISTTKELSESFVKQD